MKPLFGIVEKKILMVKRTHGQYGVSGINIAYDTKVAKPEKLSLELMPTEQAEKHATLLAVLTSHLKGAYGVEHELGRQSQVTIRNAEMRLIGPEGQQKRVVVAEVESRTGGVDVSQMAQNLKAIAAKFKENYGITLSINGTPIR